LLLSRLHERLDPSLLRRQLGVTEEELLNSMVAGTTAAKKRAGPFADVLPGVRESCRMKTKS